MPAKRMPQHIGQCASSDGVDFNFSFCIRASAQHPVPNRTKPFALVPAPEWFSTWPENRRSPHITHVRWKPVFPHDCDLHVSKFLPDCCFDKRLPCGRVLVGLMQEHRSLASGQTRPRDGYDEDGDPLITSQAVELRELNGDGRCLPCIHRARACHVKEGLPACLQCSATSSAHECMFVRKVVRQERLNYFTWSELNGFTNAPPAGSNSNNTYRESHDHAPPPPQAIQHHRDSSSHSYQEPPRPLQYGQYGAAHPTENHVERAWNAYPHQPGPSPPQPIYNSQMPPIKRQRTDMYDGQDVFGHARQPSLPGVGSSDWHSPRRSEYQLPEIRPLDNTMGRRLDDLGHKDDRSLVPPQERNPKALDLKPPTTANALPPPLKRKLELEPQETNLPHSCSKCDASFKTPAELKKHFARHEPQYFCTIANCPRGKDGFTTKNDLDRHRKTMHKILSPNDRFWKCFFPDCAKTEKVWPRLDNFKAHIVRMHGQQYVQENVARAEEWWDATKGTPMLGRSPESTADLVAIEPKPPQEQSRLGVTSLLSEGPIEQLNGRRRHLSAEGRQEAAQVRELGACLRCSLLKEKCDDSSVCQRCNVYSNKHFNGTLICRRGNMTEYLLPLVPFFTDLPQPTEATTGWNLRTSEHRFEVQTFADLLQVRDLPPSTMSFFVATNPFTTHLFTAMDDVISTTKDEENRFDEEFRAEVDVLRQLRLVCCLLVHSTVATLGDEEKAQDKAQKIDLLAKTRVELKEWYEELDNVVFDWKSRHLELNHHPMKKWVLFFSICAMLVMERLTVVMTRSWAYVDGITQESTDDEAADTLCALLEFKFQRQTLAQHHFISMLLDDRFEAVNGQAAHPLGQLASLQSISDLQNSMGFLPETKGFETWKWLYEHIGEAEGEAQPEEQDSDNIKGEEGDISDTIEVNRRSSVEKSESPNKATLNGPSRGIRSRRSASKALSINHQSQSNNEDAKRGHEASSATSN